METPDKTKMSLGVKIVIYLILLFFLYIAVKIVEIRISYKPVFDWWEKYGGNQYDVSIFNIFAGYNSWLLFYLSKLNTSPVNTLNTTQITFFVDHILKYTYYVDDKGVGQGALMPVHVAKSAKFKRGQGIQRFDHWFDGGNPSGKPKLDQDWTKDDHRGVYPNNSDIASWREKIANWAGSTDSGKDDGFWITTSGVDIPNPKTATTWSKEWQDLDKNPDNFIAAMGISPDSPIIIGFINDKFNDPNTGLLFDANAFVRVLGDSGPNLGGWLGYLKGSQKATIDSDDYVNFLYTQYSVKPNPPPASCGNDVAGWLGAIGTALGAGVGMAAMALFPGMGGWAGVMIGSGVLTGGLSLGSHAVKVATCKNART